MPQSPITATVTITAEEIAGLFAAYFLAMPLMERAGLLNALLHREPAVFAALLTRRGSEPCGVPEVDAPIFPTQPTHKSTP